MISIRRLLPISLALASIALGCGSSKETDKKGLSIEKRLESAQSLMKEAKEAGAEEFASAEFEMLVKKLDEAQTLIDDGKGDKAGSKITTASGGFKELIQRASEIKKSQAAAAESKKKAEAAIAAAKKIGVDADAPEAWDDAMKMMEKANTDLADPKRVSGASAVFSEVLNRVKTARQTADETKMWKQKAEAQMKVMKEREGKATGAGVAEQDLAFAQGQALEADNDFKNKKYREAFELYKSADLAFAEAIGRALEAKALASTNPIPEPTSSPTPPPAPPEKDTPAPSPEEPTPGVEKVAPEEPTPEAGKVAAGELSPDDEDFLVKNVGKFCTKRPVEYDPGSGMITVEYPFGDEMRKDLIFPQGIDNKYIGYKDPLMQVGSKEAKGQKEIGITFTGNTKGFFLWPFPFTETLVIEYRVYLGMMKAEGGLTAILMSSKDGKSFIGANFGTIEYWSGGKRIRAQPPPDPKLKRSPNYWFPKTKLLGVGMKIQIEPHKDGKRSQVKIFFDTDEGDGADTPINTFAVPSRSGLAGFSWFQSKFNITGLKITGKLDKQAALKILRAKLGGHEEEETSTPKAPKKESPGAEESAGAPPAAAADKKDPKKTAVGKNAGSEGDQADY